MVTRLPLNEYLKYWQAAEAQEIGLHISVQPEDQQKFINALYECRNQFGGFEDLMVFQPAPPGTVFIAKKTTELD